MGLSLVDRARARLSGRAYWQVRYRDGKVISEWDAGAEWAELPRRGLVQGRLLCPNGQVAVLGNTEELGDRLFQFNIASASVGLGGPAPSHRTHTKVMGIIQSPNLDCTLYAWEYDTRELVGPFQDTLRSGGLAFGGPATNALSFAALGAQPD